MGKSGAEPGLEIFSKTCKYQGARALGNPGKIMESKSDHGKPGNIMEICKLIMEKKKFKKFSGASGDVAPEPPFAHNLC